MDHTTAARNAARSAQNHKLLYAPQRDDERLTATSVPQAMQPSAHSGLPDPNREARVAEMRRRTQAKQAAKVEDRRNMLHTLYMNARSFITTQAELNRLVDKVFDDKEQFKSQSNVGENIWNLGYPETIQGLLANQSKDTYGGKAMDRIDEHGPATRARLDRIAEELTGGRMDSK